LMRVIRKLKTRSAVAQMKPTSMEIVDGMNVGITGPKIHRIMVDSGAIVAYPQAA
jgi:hypothetical protein